jgi:hypothetical protein
MNCLRICTAIAFVLFATSVCAFAAGKPTKVADLQGKAYVVRCNPEGTWVATWSQGADKSYTLWAVDTAKGDKFEVDTSKNPGGMCWIPNRSELLYCSAKPVSFENGVKYNSVTYFTWDVTKKKKVRVSELKDDLETYIIDPVPAEDGSKVFHMTITEKKPSFNIFFPSGKGVMSPMLVNAKVAADYDLSADGQTVYWPMSEPDSGKLVITGWGFKKNFYSGMYQINKDPAKGRAGFKVDSINRQAVTMAQNEGDPALKAAVYSFKDPKNPVAIPVKLDPTEEIVMQDWKGRSGQLYMVVARTIGQKTLFSIIEVNPSSGQRTAVLPDSTDEIRFVDYASRTGNYFYSAVVPGKGTRIVKL